MNQCCRLCSSNIENPIFSGLIFNNSVKYFECQTCAYVQTEYPHWLDKAYSSAINNCDTGIMARNQSNVGLVLATLSMLGKIDGTVVDCAGGYGILVRLLRDRGIEALWADPYCKNLLAVGFEHTGERANLITAFEAFEHFVDPMAEAEKLFSIAPNLLISTEVMATPAPALDQWWYYGLDHGQHIGFYRLKTLQILAKKFKKHFISNGKNYHLFTENPFNESLWSLNIRIARKIPFLYTRGLTSKVWQDFEKMSDRS